MSNDIHKLSVKCYTTRQ